MINRLVKMTFHPHSVDAFLEVFSRQNSLIRQFPGCRHLELWEDEDHPSTFFTFSQWASTKDLEQYRRSELFRETWETVKQGFSARAEAWTVSHKEV